jgi:hypothetical protein
MTIDFSNEKLERIANDILLLDKLARKEKAHCTGNDILETLNALVAAENLFLVPQAPYHPHPLRGDRKGSFSVHINKTHRVIFRPNHKEGEVGYHISNYKSITKITIEELCINYHN